MNILVTGSAGFIGSKVSQNLLDAGHTVMGIDNLNETYGTALKEWRLSWLKENPRFNFAQSDIVDLDGLTRLFQQHAWDAVINLAARAGVRQSIEEPWSYYETNLTGTLNLLELCRRQGVKKFVVASSSSLYGDSQGPSKEDSPTDRPLSPYAASKKAVEALCHSYHHAHDMDITALRYFTVYGPAGRPDMAIYRFIKWIFEGEPLVLYGDGTQERDFTYIDDIAAGTVLALKPVGFEAINLGSDRPVQLNTVIGLLERALDKKAVIDYQPTHASDVQATWADITKAREILGWKATVTLEEGLQRAVDWYLENREWAREVTG